MAQDQVARGRLRNRVGGVLSARSVLFVLCAGALGALVGVSLPLVGEVGGPAGSGTAGFAVGVAGGRRYVSVAAGGALAGAATAIVGQSAATLVFAGPVVVTAGAAVGAAVTAFGHYLGRDLRAGLTRPLR